MHVADDTAPTAEDHEPDAQGVQAAEECDAVLGLNVPAIHCVQVVDDTAPEADDQVPEGQLKHDAPEFEPELGL